MERIPTRITPGSKLTPQTSIVVKHFLFFNGCTRGLIWIIQLITRTKIVESDGTFPALKKIQQFSPNLEQDLYIFSSICFGLHTNTTPLKKEEKNPYLFLVLVTTSTIFCFTHKLSFDFFFNPSVFRRSGLAIGSLTAR
jgi:hypothetical protein